jgi:outer membrane protein
MAISQLKLLACYQQLFPTRLKISLLTERAFALTNANYICSLFFSTMRHLFCSIFLIISSLGLRAQNNWSLEQCIEAALKNNLNVQRAVLNAELAETNYLNQKGQFLPTVNGFLRSDINFGRTIDPFTNTFATDEVRSDAYGIQGNWELFNGMQRYNSYRQNQFEVAASKYDADKIRNDISLSVARSFLQIVFNKELLKVAEEQVNLTKMQVERTEKMVRAGSLPKGNLMDIQAQMAQEELNLVTVNNNLDLSYLQLLILMRMDTLENFDIDVPAIDVSALGDIGSTPSFVYLKAIEILPEVKSAEFRYEGSKKALATQRGRLSPILSFRGSVGSGYSGKNIDLETGQTKPFGQQVSDNFNQSIGFSLTVPIFNSLNTHSAIQRAKVDKELRENQIEQVKYEINETVKRAYFDAQAARKKYIANDKAVQAMRESYKYSERRYEVGMMNAVEFNQSKNNLIRAESDLLQAKYDYVFKNMILDFYQGLPLTLRN